jgi:hypothetical protein
MGDADEVDEGRISTESGRGARLLDGGGMKGTRVSSSSIERNCPVGWYREEEVIRELMISKRWEDRRGDLEVEAAEVEASQRV